MLLAPADYLPIERTASAARQRQRHHRRRGRTGNSHAAAGAAAEHAALIRRYSTAQHNRCASICLAVCDPWGLWADRLQYSGGSSTAITCFLSIASPC